MGTELPGTVHARCYRYRDIPLLNSKNVPIPLLRHTTNISDCENKQDHGTAVAETLIDMAPDVTLYLAQPNTNFRMRKTVDWMISEGVSVINYSMSDRWDGTGDGTSPSKYSPLRTVDRAVAGGIVWINAAGNRAKTTWTGGYVDADGDGWLEFDSLDETNEVDIQGDESFRAELRWDDPLGGSWTWASTDLDLYLYDLNGKEVASSRDLQTVRSTVPPYEFLWYRAPEGKGGLYSLRVVHRGSAIDPPQRIQLRTSTGQNLEHATAEGSISTPADSSNPGMLAAGAAAWKAWGRGAVRDYSSRGPTLDGRIKPDIVGADGGKSAVKGIFVGTSQAAPHVAGLAALVRQRYPHLSPSEVVQFLKDRAAVPGGVSVPNNEWGHGFAHLPADDLEAEKTPEPTTPPTRAPQTAAFASVSAGRGHTCGVQRDGAVACWGEYDEGQATPPAGEFASVSAGSDHTCGVQRDGSVACWGHDDDGQATPPAGEFDSVSAGFSVLRGEDGRRRACWGNSDSIQATRLAWPGSSPPSAPGVATPAG